MAAGKSRVVVEQCKKMERKLKSRVGGTRIRVVTRGAPENDLGKMDRMRAELALPSLFLWPTRSDESEEHVLRRMEAFQKAKKQEMRRRICFEKALKNQLDD